MGGSSPWPQRRGAAGGGGAAGGAGAGGAVGGLGRPGDTGIAAPGFLLAVNPILVDVSKKHPIYLLWVVSGFLSQLSPDFMSVLFA